MVPERCEPRQRAAAIPVSRPNHWSGSHPSQTGSQSHPCSGMPGILRSQGRKLLWFAFSLPYQLPYIRRHKRFASFSHRKAKNTASHTTMSLKPAAADPPPHDDDRSGTDLPQFNHQESPFGAGPPPHEDPNQFKHQVGRITEEVPLAEATPVAATPANAGQTRTAESPTSQNKQAPAGISFVTIAHPKQTANQTAIQTANQTANCSLAGNPIL
jgi:hypothetical protein